MSKTVNKTEKQIKDTILRELRNEKEVSHRQVQNISNLLGSEWRRIDLLKILTAVNTDTLKSYYKQITAVYENKYRRVTMPTTTERRVANYLAVRTHKTIYRSFWIGPFNFDMFIPSVAGRPGDDPRLKGVVIEVDGPIHNFEDKMVKDEIRGDFLKRLEIAHIGISNDRVNENNLNEQLEGWQLHSMTDTKAKDRLFRVIYIATIISFSGNLIQILQGMGENSVRQ